MSDQAATGHITFSIKKNDEGYHNCLIELKVDGDLNVIADRLIGEGATAEEALREGLQSLIGENHLGFKKDSPTFNFVNQRCHLGKGFEVKASDLFEAWKSWCSDESLRHGNMASFFKNLFAVSPPVIGRCLRGGQQFWTGIRLKETP